MCCEGVTHACGQGGGELLRRARDLLSPLATGKIEKEKRPFASKNTKPFQKIASPWRLLVINPLRTPVPFWGQNTYN